MIVQKFRKCQQGKKLNPECLSCEKFQPVRGCQGEGRKWCMRWGGEQVNQTFDVKSSRVKGKMQIKSYESTRKDRFLQLGNWGWFQGEGA